MFQELQAVVLGLAIGNVPFLALRKLISLECQRWLINQASQNLIGLTEPHV